MRKAIMKRQTREVTRLKKELRRLERIALKLPVEDIGRWKLSLRHMALRKRLEGLA